MPDYLAPGVYVTEIALDAAPVEGVSTYTADLIGSDVIAKLRALLETITPDWTQHNTHDSGVALVELFAWFTEMYVRRIERLPEYGMPHAARLAAAALALVTDREQPPGTVLKRAHFFEGQLLDVDELRAEMDARRQRLEQPAPLHGFYGLYSAVVVSNADPHNRLRLQVNVPSVMGDLALWAHACVPVRLLEQPAVGSNVWILFEEGSADRPVWIGTAPTIHEP